MIEYNTQNYYNFFYWFLKQELHLENKLLWKRIAKNYSNNFWTPREWRTKTLLSTWRKSWWTYRKRTFCRFQASKEMIFLKVLYCMEGSSPVYTIRCIKCMRHLSQWYWSLGLSLYKQAAHLRLHFALWLTFQVLM